MSDVETRNDRRIVTGIVTAEKMDKTIKVTIQRQIKHPIYEKRMRRSTVLAAHDEKNEASVGDIVEVMETRKLSKTKNWRLIKIVKKAEKVK
jgi:small subunit ribosomal protein S17